MIKVLKLLLKDIFGNGSVDVGTLGFIFVERLKSFYGTITGTLKVHLTKQGNLNVEKL